MKRSLNKDSIQWKVCLFAVLSLSTLVSYIRLVEAQEEKMWNSVTNELEKKSHSVKSIKAIFHYSRFNTMEGRVAFYNHEKQFVGSEYRGFFVDPNIVSSILWINKGLMWRCDKSRMYPRTGYDYKQQIFDGEKGYSYNTLSQVGVIAGEAQVNPEFNFINKGDCRTFDEDSIVGTGLIKVTQEFLQKDVPTYEKTELIDGLDADKYIFNDKETHFALWYASKLNSIVKMDYGKEGKVENYSVVIVAKQFTKTGDIFTPRLVKREVYKIKEGKRVWRGTDLVLVKDVEINKDVTLALFQNGLIVGSKVEDQLENPGQLTYVGGDPTEEIERVRAGVPPQLELPNIEANGASPLVSEAQSKLEMMQ